MLLEELNIIFSKINKNKDNFDLFIETGSYIGETLSNIKFEFKKLISIEITERYSSFCKIKFTNDINVEIIKGDSLIELPKIIDVYRDKKIVFYLDGHYSAGDTGKNNIDVPLIEEMKIISNKCTEETLIIIDDADLFEYFDSNVSWVGINEKNILETLKNRTYKYFYSEYLKPHMKVRLIIELDKK